MAKKLLVVDDCEDIRFLLSSLFSQMGYDVIVAECGEKALEILEESPLIDVVISDVLMPKGDGLWLLNKVKNLNKKIPMFFITAGTDISRSEAISFGVIDLFRKPLNIAEMEKALKRVLFEQESVGL